MPRKRNGLSGCLLCGVTLCLLLTGCGASIKKAGKLLKGKRTPVFLAPVGDTTLRGLVQSNRRPGGNMTGVRVALDPAKMIEWIRRITPGVKGLFVPYGFTASDPPVLTSAASAAGLALAAPQLKSPDDSKDPSGTALKGYGDPRGDGGVFHHDRPEGGISAWPGPVGGHPPPGGSY